MSSTSNRMDADEPRVVLEPILKDQAPVLQNLLELYVHDFSEHVPIEVKSNGRFELSLDDCWWTSADHFPFFIRSRGKLCGFALVKRGSRITGASDPMDVAEFFVLRGVRGKTVGTQAAHALFTAFPSHWEIRVRRANALGLRFWSSAVAAWVEQPVASTPVSLDGIDWEVFRVAPQGPQVPGGDNSARSQITGR